MAKTCRSEADPRRPTGRERSLAVRAPRCAAWSTSVRGPARVARMEIDIDANPVVAKQLSVLALPTTLIFDAGGRQRYRSAGVPKATGLRTALAPLFS